MNAFHSMNWPNSMSANLNSNSVGGNTHDSCMNNTPGMMEIGGTNANFKNVQNSLDVGTQCSANNRDISQSKHSPEPARASQAAHTHMGSPCHSTAHNHDASNSKIPPLNMAVNRAQSQTNHDNLGQNVAGQNAAGQILIGQSPSHLHHATSSNIHSQADARLFVAPVPVASNKSNQKQGVPSGQNRAQQPCGVPNQLVGQNQKNNMHVSPHAMHPWPSHPTAAGAQQGVHTHSLPPHIPSPFFLPAGSAQAHNVATNFSNSSAATNSDHPQHARSNIKTDGLTQTTAFLRSPTAATAGPKSSGNNKSPESTGDTPGCGETKTSHTNGKMAGGSNMTTSPTGVENAESDKNDAFNSEQHGRHVPTTSSSTFQRPQETNVRTQNAHVVFMPGSAQGPRPGDYQHTENILSQHDAGSRAHASLFPPIYNHGHNHGHAAYLPSQHQFPPGWHDAHTDKAQHHTENSKQDPGGGMPVTLVREAQLRFAAGQPLLALDQGTHRTYAQLHNGTTEQLMQQSPRQLQQSPFQLQQSPRRHLQQPPFHLQQSPSQQSPRQQQQMSHFTETQTPKGTMHRDVISSEQSQRQLNFPRGPDDTRQQGAHAHASQSVDGQFTNGLSSQTDYMYFSQNISDRDAGDEHMQKPQSRKGRLSLKKTPPMASGPAGTDPNHDANEGAGGGKIESRKNRLSLKKKSAFPQGGKNYVGESDGRVNATYMHSRRDGDDDDDDDESSGHFILSQQRDMQTARGPNDSHPGQMAQNGGTQQPGEEGVYYGYYVPGHVQASHSFMSQLHMQRATAAQAPQNNYMSIPLHVLRQKMMQLQQETLQHEHATNNQLLWHPHNQGGQDLKEKPHTGIQTQIQDDYNPPQRTLSLEKTSKMTRMPSTSSSHSDPNSNSQASEQNLLGASKAARRRTSQEFDQQVDLSDHQYAVAERDAVCWTVEEAMSRHGAVTFKQRVSFYLVVYVDNVYMFAVCVLLSVCCTRVVFGPCVCVHIYTLSTYSTK
jgi:hypothetical protein